MATLQPPTSVPSTAPEGQSSPPSSSPVATTGGTAPKSPGWFVANFQDIKVLAGIAALAALIGTGTITSTEGLPLLTGLIGLSINTTPSS